MLVKGQTESLNIKRQTLVAGSRNYSNCPLQSSNQFGFTSHAAPVSSMISPLSPRGARRNILSLFLGREGALGWQGKEARACLLATKTRYAFPIKGKRALCGA